MNDPLPYVRLHFLPVYKSMFLGMYECMNVCMYVCLYEGRKEMFFLTTHSTSFCLQLYGVGHMVKDHSDSERGNPLPPHGLMFPISSKGSFI